MAILTDAALHTVLCTFALVGLTVYVMKRRRFLNSVKGVVGVGLQSVFFGLFIAAVGGFWGFFFFSSLLVYFHQVPGGVFFGHVRSENMLVFSLAFVWSILFFISGVLSLIDGLTILEDYLPKPSEEKIDLEDAWKRYPRDLFEQYLKQYPHNPEGVLEWHIHKKMKEGKTREHAIKELQE